MKNILDDDYFPWLSSLGVPYYVVYRDHEWELFNEQKLNEEINIDGLITPRWKQLESFAQTYSEVTGEDETVDQFGNAFSLERLKKGITIGDDNGDPLFIDPKDSNSVWCYHHDGGDVEKLCNSLEELRNMAYKST